ncbi:MAG: sodium:solute symporter [Lacrimispora sp.]|uniref:sodium:solute symporter n=1 Tax=Lacrimispora sp. TaxID=2719234 RepID=UPI0039E2D007
MKQAQKQRYGIWLFLLVFAAGILHSLESILHQETFQWVMNQNEYRTMLAETAGLLAAFCAFGLLIPGRRQRTGAAALLLSIFLWVHQVFFPVLVSGLYMAYLVFAGRFLRTVLWKLPGKDGTGADFLTGSAFLIAVFCLMSALGIGSIPYLTGFVLISGAAVSIVWKLQASRKHPREIVRAENQPWNRREVLLLAFLMAMVCLQAGRLNISVDYDSLWYGVRSGYILNNGRGIYENMGTIGIVYTYSKGFEVLTLPLSLLPSYSFLTSVNLWLAGGVLYMGCRIGRLYMNRERSVFLAALLSATPGIMNMAVTAKSDVMTLLVQEIMIYHLLCCIKAGPRSWRHLCYGISAFFLSLTLKPTALVFSTAAFGMALLCIFGKGFLPQRKSGMQNTGSLAVLAASAVALAGIWARTMVITGLPLTSVFSSLLTRLGFQMKYPFEVNTIPNSAPTGSIKEQAFHLIKRIYGFFLSPTGRDMDHVILAWGGFVLYFLFILWIISRFYGKNVDRASNRNASVLLTMVYIPFLLVNLVSLVMLHQVDGNYFMLFYVLTAVYVLKTALDTGEKAVWRAAMGAGAGIFLFSLFITSMTNWSWSVGFSPPSLRHKGYYNHREAARQDMVFKGNERIWDILASDPRTRLIAVGDHPQVLSFPCSAQSYDDITGVWGNVVLVKKMDYFVEFMDYAKTDYVYVQAGYMGGDLRSYTLVKDLIEWGKLVPVFYEKGNLLAAVDINGEHSQTSVQASKEFEQYYLKKEAEEQQ